MRIIAIIVGVLLAARPAEACGEWSMSDHEKKRTISYLINSARVFGANDKVVGSVYFDIESKQAKEQGMRAVHKRKVQFDIKDGKLRKYGKVVATIDGNNITFGRRVYTIELSNPHMEHEVMQAWDLVVKRGEQVILESKEASSLCSGLEGDMTIAQKEDEVRRRVMYYLAWREVGG